MGTGDNQDRLYIFVQILGQMLEFGNNFSDILKFTTVIVVSVSIILALNAKFFHIFGSF